jgi:hypothetical protein
MANHSGARYRAEKMLALLSMSGAIVCFKENALKSLCRQA